MDSELKNLIGEFEKIAKETKKVEVVDENKVDTSTPDNSVQNLMSELSNAFKESKKKITPPPIKVQESDLTDFFSVIKEAKKEVSVVEIATWPREQPSKEYEEPEIPEVVEPKIKIEEVESLFSPLVDIVVEAKQDEPIENISEEMIVGFEETSDEDIIKTYAEQIKNTAPKLIGKPQQHDVYETDLSNIEGLKQEFIRFKARTIEQLGSLGGGGEVNFARLDDINTTGQEDGDVVTYNASTGKYELKSSTSTTSTGQLLSDEDGSNIVFNATDDSGTSEGDDILLESGVGGGRDIDQSVLQVLTTDIIPQQGGKFNLGSPTHRFKNIFLEANTIDLDGALIKSDGSGQITISAEGAILPVGSKDTDGKELVVSVAQTNTSGVLTAQATKTVSLFTQSSGLNTPAATFTFAKTLSRRSVYTNSGHTFLLSNGNNRADQTVELFEF
jgi:hypothetical protein